MDLKSEKRDKDEVRQIVLSMNLMDDDFFHKVAEDIGAMEELLQEILGDKELHLKYVEPQKFLRNCGKRSVRIDVLCTAVDGRRYGIEVQKRNVDDHQRRVRYEGSNIDTVLTEQGIDFEDIPDVCMVYIAKFDVFKEGHLVYRVNRTLEGSGATVENGFKEIYVNTKADDGSRLSKLMQYMVNTIGECLEFPRISKRVKYLREENGGVEEMCEAVERYAERYAERVKMEEKENTVMNLFRNGADFELVVASITGMTRERILELYALTFKPLANTQ